MYDANVLYPAPLRDLFVRLAQAGLAHAKVTETIHEEWIRALLCNNPSLSRSRLERARRLMDLALPDSLVTGYEPLIDRIVLPDPGDRHVLAAAIHAGASAIVTKNLRDFPEKALKQHGVEALAPDAFVIQAMAQNRDAVVRVLREQRSDLKNPPVSVERFLDVMERQGLPRAVNKLRALADQL